MKIYLKDSEIDRYVIILFAEHGQSSSKTSSLIQKLVTPLTRLFTGNCHLDRKIDQLIRESGLTAEEIKIFPEKRKPLMFSYCGIAVK
jgi:hypothetical protein